MHARLLAFWDDLRSSYWFIPSLMAVGAVALALGTVHLDTVLGDEWIRGVDWLRANKPDGARQLLSTVAGSMIGVAGVTFSITIASVVYASGQYGPRLLTNFMADRGNQVTLGTFIATFLFCLLVLRTIRAADEPAGDAADAFGPFVPHIAILVAFGLALASIAVLIFFIHHVPESIHVSNVIAGVGRELDTRVRTLFPERIGEDAGEDAPADTPTDAVDVAADGAGYVQGVDSDALVAIAAKHDLVLHVCARPGDFVAEGDALVSAAPPDRVSDDARDALRLAFAWGNQRTGRQDVRFLFNELVEIAARALSPGVNDPFTAISCLDWMSAALKRLAAADVPGPNRLDDAGTLRVVALPTRFPEFVDVVYGQLRPYLAGDRNAALHALVTLGEVAGRTRHPSQLAALRVQADALAEAVRATLVIPADLAAVQAQADATALRFARAM